MEVKILKQTTAMDWKLIAVLFMIRVSFAFISFKQRIIASLFISGVVKTGVEKRYSISVFFANTNYSLNFLYSWIIYRYTVL